MICRRWLSVLGLVLVLACGSGAESLSPQAFGPLDVAPSVGPSSSLSYYGWLDGFFTNELAAAEAEVKRLTAPELEALVAGIKTRSQVAVAMERASVGLESQATTFLLLRWALLTHAAAGNLGKAQQVVKALQARGFSQEVLLALIREAEIDLSCRDPNCPRLLDSFLAEDLGGRFAVEDPCEELSDLGRLKFGDSVGAEMAKLDAENREFNPLNPEVEESVICVRRKSVVVPIGGVGKVRAELFYTKGTRKLYKVIFRARYGSGVKRSEAIDAMRAIGRKIYDLWGVEGCMVTQELKQAKVRVADNHRQALSPESESDDLLESLLAEDLPICVLMTIRDFGVFDYRCVGKLEEDIHHCKHLELRLLSERYFDLALRECRVDPAAAADIGRGFSSVMATNTIEHLEKQLAFTAMKVEKGIGGQLDFCLVFGALGRAYDRGLYGASVDREYAIACYRAAAKYGNEDALARLKELGDDPQRPVEPPRPRRLKGRAGSR